MIEELYGFLEYIGISRENLYTQTEHDATLVSFYQEMTHNSRLLVTVGIHDIDERAEICVSKEKQNAEEYEMLLHLNQLNSQYSGITFFAVQDAVFLKVVLEGEYELEELVAKLVLAIQVAKEEFGNI